MFKFVLIASLLLIVASAAPITRSEAEELEKSELERMQNESAQYAFNSFVDDKINDGQVERQETREGSKVQGSYSYSDGYVKRIVTYVADENGYRVIKEETMNIGDGPQFNADGQADVQGSLIGKYSIKLDKEENDKHYKEVQGGRN